MVKIFEGERHAVETEVNDWIEVYHPQIRDIKQSVIPVEREHRAVIVLTILYEARSETQKVEYRMFEKNAKKEDSY